MSLSIWWGPNNCDADDEERLHRFPAVRLENGTVLPIAGSVPVCGDVALEPFRPEAPLQDASEVKCAACRQKGGE